MRNPGSIPDINKSFSSPLRFIHTAVEPTQPSGLCTWDHRGERVKLTRYRVVEFYFHSQYTFMA
jgi:hypothetical protein